MSVRKLWVAVFALVFIAGPAWGKLPYSPHQNSPHYYQTSLQDSLTVRTFGDTTVSVRETLQRGDLIHYRKTPHAFEFTLNQLMIRQTSPERRTGPFERYREQLAHISAKRQGKQTKRTGRIGSQARDLTFRSDRSGQAESLFINKIQNDKTSDQSTDTDTEAQNTSDTNERMPSVFRVLAGQTDTEADTASRTVPTTLDQFRMQGLFAEQRFTQLYDRLDFREGRSFTNDRTVEVAGVPVRLRVRFRVESIHNDTVTVKGGKQSLIGTQLKSLFLQPFKSDATEKLPTTYRSMVFQDPQTTTEATYQSTYTLRRSDGMVLSGEWRVELHGRVTVRSHEKSRDAIMTLQGTQTGTIKRRLRIETRFLPTLAGWFNSS